MLPPLTARPPLPAHMSPQKSSAASQPQHASPLPLQLQDEEEDGAPRSRAGSSSGDAHVPRGKARVRKRGSRKKPAPPATSGGAGSAALREAVTQYVHGMVEEGLWRACWQLGAVPKKRPPTFLRHQRPALSTVASEADHRWMMQEGGLLHIVDRAKDSEAMEWLVHDLALALPQVGSLVVSSASGSKPFTSSELRERMSSISSIMSSDGGEASFSFTPEFEPRPRSVRSGPLWGSASQLASISMAVAVAAVQEPEQYSPLPLHFSYDPSRDDRVALVVELAEQERQRRIQETEVVTLEERLDRAARIEWAVIATEAERERRALADLARAEREERARVRARQLASEQEESERQRRVAESAADVAVAPPAETKLYAQDYEVICPYSMLGCDATLRLSELPAHFETCQFRAEVKEARRRAELCRLYNPLDHVVVCPYAVVGCGHSCSRADLPAHLAVCSFKGELGGHSERQSEEYEVVCPYTILGCEHTCLRSGLSRHLDECAFRPRSRQEEDAEREKHRAYALEAEEAERVRRLDEARGGDGAQDSHARIQLLQAISKTVEPELGDVAQLRLVLRRRRVSWVVQAAEIERMRHAEELIAKATVPVSPTPSPPPPSQQQHHQPPASQHHQPPFPASDESPPPPHFSSKSHFLNDVLQRQRLQRQHFPQEVLQGRKTHFNSFHDHLEHQTRLLHRALHDELERFGRDCALWELGTQTTRDRVVALVQQAVLEAWPASWGERPLVCVFGSFASELAVPGVSDLDLVVVDESRVASKGTPGALGPPSRSASLDAAGGGTGFMQQPPPRPAGPPSRSSSIDAAAAGSPGGGAAAPPLTRAASGPLSPPRDYAATARQARAGSWTELSASPSRPGGAGPQLAASADRAGAALRCQLVGEVLARCALLADVRVIDTAQMPVVKMTSLLEPRLDVDLTVALPSHDGLAVAEFCRTLRARFPQLMPVVRLLKAFLAHRGMSDPYRGGLSSYALVLMAATSIIKSFERAGRSALSQGELLVDFLALFGREFDPAAEAVVCNLSADIAKLGVGRLSSGPPLLRVAKRELSCVYLESAPGFADVALVVDDPVRPGNNVGRACFCFPVVQTAFTEALAALLSHVVRNEAIGRRAATHEESLLQRIFGVKLSFPASFPLAPASPARAHEE